MNVMPLPTTGIPLLLVSALSLFPTAAPAAAQEAGVTEPVRVLVLGVYHFANPGLDVVKTEVADVLSPTKQEEIQAVVDAIARFRPTKITVEQLPASAARLDSLYAAYRSGEHELSRNETEQLGFRLAARFEHVRVHPIDHRGEFPFEAVMEYAQRNDPDFVDFVQRELARITEETNREQRENTVGEILRTANDPALLAEGHGAYVRFATVGAGDTYVGADLLAKWYDRNIRIFANLKRVVEPGDRVLVVIGSGHAPILRELVTYDPDIELVEATEFLPAPTGR
ncbi:MAG: DUF5694 domain-containing protein [Gemmatimonadota bacterium]